jgi:hypothetical protein
LGPLRSGSSCGSKAGWLDCVTGGQRRLNESQKTSLGSQETYLKTSRVTVQKESLNLYLEMLKR